MEKTLTGRVKNLTGANESGVEVGVFGTDISVKTDKDGIYTIPDAPIGKDGVMLTFSKFPYKDIMKTYDLDTVEASGALGDVDMFAEFGGSQRMQFAIARQEAGIRFVFRTETLFGTNEIMWPYIMYANETNVNFYALQAPGSGVESAWGVTSLHPLFPGDIGGAWGAAIIGHDTYDFKIVDGVTYIDWFIPYTEPAVRRCLTPDNRLLFYSFIFAYNKFGFAHTWNCAAVCRPREVSEYVEQS